MIHQALSRIWPHVPVAQRRRLIAQLSQMATQYLQTIRPAEETLDERNKDPQEGTCDRTSFALSN
jgi:hypothetical protein